MGLVTNIIKMKTRHYSRDYSVLVCYQITLETYALANHRGNSLHPLLVLHIYEHPLNCLVREIVNKNHCCRPALSTGLVHTNDLGGPNLKTLSAIKAIGIESYPFTS